MEKNKLNLPIIILCICILISSFLLIKEAINIKGTLDNISNIKEEINGLNEKLVYLKGYEKNSEEMLNMLDKYRRSLPESVEENNIILELSKIAYDNSIKVNELRFNEGKPEETILKTPFAVNLSGDYFDIVKFIVGLKENERIFAIRKINIARSGDSQDLITDIEINTYNKR